MTEKKIAKLILTGKIREAWPWIVKEFTDHVFYVAQKWTMREIFSNNNEPVLQYQYQTTNKSGHYSEETSDAYLWLFQQLEYKFKYFRGEVPLDKFVWSHLNSPNLFKTWLIHKNKTDPFYIPKIVENEPEHIQQILILWRMNKSDEQIQRKIRLEYKMDLTLDELTQTKNHILELLIKAGLQDLVAPAMEVELKESLVDQVADLPENDIEQKNLNYLTLAECIKKLERGERDFINLFYIEDLSVAMMVAVYERTGRKLPGQTNRTGLQEKAVHNCRNRIIKKLKICMEQ